MTRPLNPDDLYRIKVAADPQIAPDGAQVAYVVAEMDRDSYEYRHTIWVAPTSGDGAPRRFTSGPNDSQPRWSPDGSTLAFVRAPAGEVKPHTAAERDRGVGQPQIWVMPSDGGEGRQLTWARDGASGPVWSPESKQIAYTADVGAPDDAEAADAALAEKRVPAVRTIERLWYREDGHGWNYERRTHLFLVAVQSGDTRQITDGDWDDNAPAWSPDGRRLAFTSDRAAERWRWPGSDIWVMDLASSKLTHVTDESLQCGAAAWSPDGTTLAFAAAPRRRSDGHVDLWVAPSDASAPARRLTADWTPTVGDTCIDDQRAGHGPALPYWTSDGARILFLASYRGTAHVHSAALAGGEPEAVTTGDRHICGFSLDGARRTLALVISDPVTPGDLYAQASAGNDEPRRLTELNAVLAQEVAFAQPETFDYAGADGWSIQGWTLRPPSAHPGDVTPAVLQVHGGPHAMYGWSFFYEFQLLAARGYTVVYTNPRGSTGYGRAFAEAVIGDWGGKDYADILAGLDTAIARGGIDAARLGVAGGSYGGYMTNWVVGHTDRFKAAVTMRCVSNLATMFGTSDIGWDLTVDYFDTTPWDNLERLMDRSPIKYVANVHTPLLILHSDNDLRCPIGEGEQMYAALKYLGRPVKMMRFEGQSHDLSRSGHPRSRVLRLRAIVDWFERYMPATAGATPHREAAEVAAPAHE